MAKTKNILGTRIVRVSGNRILEYYLEKLVETGLYGHNTAEAAGVLISREIERLVGEGRLPQAPDSVLDHSRNSSGSSE